MKWYIYIPSITTDRPCTHVQSKARRLVVLGRGLRELLVRLVLGLLLVDEVEALGLDHAVDEGTRETGTEMYKSDRGTTIMHGQSDVQELLGLSVAVGLAVGSDVLLVRLRGLVGGGGSDELVRELGLVGRVGDLYAPSAYENNGMERQDAPGRRPEPRWSRSQTSPL